MANSAQGHLSLSTSWNAHRYQDGELLAREVRDMGFPCIEISSDTPEALMAGLLKAAGQGIIKAGSMQAPGFAPGTGPDQASKCFELNSPNAEERRRAVSLTLATFETAARFGVDRVVLRLGAVLPVVATLRLEQMAMQGGLFGREYVKRKLELVVARANAAGAALQRLKQSLDELLPQAEKHGVRMGLQTCAHFEQAPAMEEMGQLLMDYKSSPWLASWHDFGHVQRQANLGFLNHEAYLRLNAPRLLGCHVHEVAWPATEHQIPFSAGEVDFDRLIPLVPAGVPLVWVLNPRQKRLQIMAAREQWENRFNPSAQSLEATGKS